MEHTGIINVDGNSRSRYNALGLLIAPSDEALTQFWRWFGDSAIVDEAGRPLAVFHGSNAVFDSFDKERISGTSCNEFGAGFYFSPHVGMSLLHGPCLIAAYLKVNRPKIVSTLDRNGCNGWHGEHDGVIAVYADADSRRDPVGWAEIVVGDNSQIKIIEIDAAFKSALEATLDATLAALKFLESSGPEKAPRL